MKGFESHRAQRRPTPLADDQVSLCKTVILLSKGLARQFGSAHRVVLLYSPKQEVIAIRRAREGEKGYKLTCRAVTSSSFYSFFGITARGRYHAFIDESGCLMIPLTAG